ncbi:hypothetical protein K435DRAFT_964029 [Dendrothele bispora CBS 962.96]|uniref:Uncharacterized protein n=1 Tax=Dendrothele bispora (strain CBS 962.96) TaxID=1314807 RepID=A0A4S8MD71_DENBC|nr:hypothetical protein K435DRAFT_964029 [Dendrothele bispora CBS 962.96]
MASTTRPSNPDFVSVRSGGVQRRHSWDADSHVRARTTSPSSPPKLNFDNSANPLRAVSAMNTFSRVTTQTQIQMFNESRNTRFTRSTVNNVGGDDRRHNDIYNLRFQNIRANISGNTNITLNFGQEHQAVIDSAQPIQAQEKNIPGGIALGLTHPIYVFIAGSFFF